MADELGQPSQRAADASGPQPAPARERTEAENRQPEDDQPDNPYRVPLQPPTSGQSPPDDQRQRQQPGPPPPGYPAPGYPAPGYPPPGYPPAGYAPPGYGYGQQQPGYQGQPPPYYQQAPYQQAPNPQGPYAWSPGPQVKPTTEPQAILALVLAVMAWLVIPIGPAILAFIVAAIAKNGILASHGARGGLGMVRAARWIATLHLIVLPVGFIVFGKLTLTGALF